MNIPEKIEQILKRLPTQPGVYLMKDESGEVIYIGKAASLKKRVSSYFQKKGHDIKTATLVKSICDIEYIVTDSEIEALLLEINLVKKQKPKFNIRLKDDKRYPYIAVTLDEEFPRIRYTRNLSNKNNRYFGPYTDAKAAKRTISMINSLFKLKTCSRDIPLKKGERPCLNFQMKRCHGPCVGTINKDEYRSLVDNAISFLEGHIDPVLEDLSARMNTYSVNMDYEKAASIRDIIFDIRKVSESQKVSAPIGEDRDYIGVLIQGAEAILILFEFRQGVLLGRKISVFENAEYSEPKEIIKSFILDYYERSEIPVSIITEFRIDDRDILEQFLTEKSSRKVSISLPVSTESKGVINMIRKNIDLIAADRKAAENYKERGEGLIALQNALGLPVLPETIECFDISNIQGSFAVASMVCFRNGLPDNKSYRRYKIRGYDSPNDPGMMHEVVARRVQHLVNEGGDLPDIMVMDGGITQLSRAMEAAANFDAHIKIVSIAKRFEEIYFDVKKDPVRLPLDSPALNIIRHIRDEAHRFAITYHRTIRDKALTGSVLDDIPNVGSKTKKLLLGHFKSIDNIKQATMDDLTKVTGIGEKSAEVIFRFFREEER
ncbi:MAG: excinuclease ABC subunit UvrC [bacterium]|nr:excinuclease ABC subunit UvrC [bacterium]